MRTRRAPSEEVEGAGVPLGRSALLGRDAEVEALRGLLRSESPVLVNVSGVRGVGKTALVRAVLDEVGPDFAEVRRLDLTGESHASALAGLRRHLATLPVPLRPGLDSRAGGQLLLALDRADVLAHGMPELVRLLTGHVGVSVVAETVPPLADPDVTVLVLGPLPEDAGVELLRHSARAAGAPVDPERTSTEHLRRIARAVEGNPLALELAAARLRSVSATALATALESPQRALSLLSRPAPDGHDSPVVRDLLQDAYRSASVPARQLLDLLGVFTGPFTVEAIEAVCADRGGSCFDPLGELLDLRLLELDTSGSTGRYRLSRLVHDFATERLEAGTQGLTACARHAEHFCRIARAAARAAEAADDDTARDLIEDDYPEAILALRWLQHSDPARALRLGSDLAVEAYRRGGGASVVEVLEQLVNGTRATDGTTASDEGVLDDRGIPAATAEQAARRDALLWLVRLASWSPLVSDQSDLIRARLEEGMALARSIGEPLALLQALRTEFLARTAQGDVAAAVRACSEGIALASAVGHARWLGRFEVSLGAVHGALRQYAEAARLASSGLARALRSGDRGGVALGALALHTLPPEHVAHVGAVPPLESVLEILSERGDVHLELHTLATLAQRQVDRRDPVGAAGYVLDRLERLGQRDLLHGLTVSVMLAVRIAGLRGDHETAARLHGSVAAQMQPLLVIMAPAHVLAYQDQLATARASLGQARFDTAVTTGQLLDRGDTLVQTVRFLHEAAEAVDRDADRSGSSSPLTPREDEVLTLMARGLRNKEIATRLRITPKTVMHHTVAIYRKLGVRSRTEAVSLARPHD